MVIFALGGMKVLSFAFVVGVRVPPNFWLREFKSVFFNSMVHKSGVGPIFYRKMLHIRI